jgi:transcriptional regulator with XRE-family HTH domain
MKPTTPREVRMEQLKRLRTAKGLSQAKLAARADVDPSTVNQIERGAREASPATLRKLADALDVSIAELLEDTAPKAERRSSPEPSFNDVLDEERRIVAARGLEDEIRHFTSQWLEDLKNAEARDRYWYAGVQLIATGYTELLARLNLWRKLHGIWKLDKEAQRRVFRENRSDPEFTAAFDLLGAWLEMHKAADEVENAAEALWGDWLAREEAEQRRRAFSVIQGEMPA